MNPRPRSEHPVGLVDVRLNRRGGEHACEEDVSCSAIRFSCPSMPDDSAPGSSRMPGTGFGDIARIGIVPSEDQVRRTGHGVVHARE